MPDNPTYVYRAYDIFGELLYVGVADRWPRRWTQHQRDKFWFPDVARLEVDPLPTRRAALDTEARLIREYRPKYNIVHNTAPMPVSMTPEDARRKLVERLQAANPPKPPWSGRPVVNHGRREWIYSRGDKR